MNNLIIILFLLFLSGCETLYTGIDNLDYQSDLSEIEHAYQEGKMTYSEYQQAKRDLAEEASQYSREKIEDK